MREIALTVPDPAEPDRLDRFLAAQLHGLSRRQVKGLLDAGQVRVNGRPERKAGRALRPRELVLVALRPSLLDPPALTRGDLLAQGEDWIAVLKPPGLSTHRSDHGGVGVPERLAPLLGVAAESLRPVHRLDGPTSGVLLVARDEAAAARLSERFAAHEVGKQYLAVVAPPPPQDARTLEDDDEGHPMTLSFVVLRRSRDGSRAELLVTPRQGRTHQIRRQLAGAGTPIVGDLRYGIARPGGAPRMALHCRQLEFEGVRVEAPPPRGWESLLEPAGATEPAQTARSVQTPTTVQAAGSMYTARKVPTPAPQGTTSLPSLRVSRATARILRSGHPWVLPDRDTGDLGSFVAGDQALLLDPEGASVGVALVDPHAEVAARVLDASGRTRVSDHDFGERAKAALRLRERLLAEPETDCLRLVHGEADGLPGLTIDLWGPELLVATRTAAAASTLSAPVYSALRERFPTARLYEKDHIVDLRRRGVGKEGDELPGRWIHGSDEATDNAIMVQEDGLRYRVEPLRGLTTGLYPDQRDNRRRLAALVQPQTRLLNLFAHTGAFSVRVAAAGAARVVSVDLAPRYCAWAEENLRRNGLDPSAHPVRAGAADATLDALRGAGERFSMLVLDPPAFARARGHDSGWNARRDSAGLLRKAAGVLHDGPATVLVVINTKGVRPLWLRGEVEAGLRGAGRRALSIIDAPPAPDTPTRRGFPEGVPFRGLLITVAPR